MTSMILGALAIALAVAPLPTSAVSKLFLSGRDSQLTSSSVGAERRHERVQSDPRWNTIWTFYQYPNHINYLTLLNMDTWRHNAPHMNIVLLNNSNIRDYVPDLPEEFFRLVISQEKSDVIRAALLYHQGGVYMDTDFLLMKPLTDVLEKLETHDVVAYSNDQKSNSTECERHFTSNFMAGRKGNAFSKTWWNNIRGKLTRVCEDGQRGNCERVCCHERSDPVPEKRGCYVPFAGFEHMKVPLEDHDRAVHGPKLQEGGAGNVEFIKQGMKKCHERWGNMSAADAALAKEYPEGVKTFCFKGSHSMSPHLNGQIFWQPWNPSFQKTLPLTALALESPKSTTITTLAGPNISVANNFMSFHEYDDRFDCNELLNGSLACNTGNWGMKGDYSPRDPRRMIDNFFGRHAYHLFFSTFLPKHITSKEMVLEGDWLLSEMYRRALSLDGLS